MRVQPLHFQGSVEQTWAPILDVLCPRVPVEPIAAAIPAASQAIHA
jgi:hypothetical protein